MFCRDKKPFQLTDERRHVSGREYRIKVDWAEESKRLFTAWDPDALRVRLLMDSLDAYAISSWDEAFDLEAAGVLVKRLDIHYTLKHGSWLSFAAGELPAITRQCWGQRYAPDRPTAAEPRLPGGPRSMKQKGCGSAVRNKRCTDQTSSSFSKAHKLTN